MSRSSEDDITRRKRTMIAEALKAAEAIEDKPKDKPKRETVSLEEALKTEMLVNQALIDVLIAKGIITQEELLNQIIKLRNG